MVAGATFGGLLSWWLAQPVPPWIEFGPITALYKDGSTAIAVSGPYTVNHECPNEKFPPIWRAEALATDGQIAIYGPKPTAPSLVAGAHYYSDFLPLLEPINPDGWKVTVIATCPGKSPETVASRAALVQMLPGSVR